MLALGGLDDINSGRCPQKQADDDKNRDSLSSSRNAGCRARTAVVTTVATIATRATAGTEKSAEFLLQIPDYFIKVWRPIIATATPWVAIFAARLIPSH